MIRRQGGSLSGIGCNISLGDEEAEFDIFQKASPLPVQNGQKVIACPSSALIFMLSKIALHCAEVLVKSSLCCKNDSPASSSNISAARATGCDLWSKISPIASARYNLHNAMTGWHDDNPKVTCFLSVLCNSSDNDGDENKSWPDNFSFQLFASCLC